MILKEKVYTLEKARVLMGPERWDEFVRRDEYYRKRYMVDEARRFGQKNADKPGLSFSMAEKEFSKLDQAMEENLAYEIIDGKYQRFEYPRAKITEADKDWMMAVYSNYGMPWGG